MPDEIGTARIEWSLRLAALFTVIGALMILVAVADRSDADDVDVQIVALHNQDAESETGCPSDGPAWHFVIAPNNGDYQFVSIVLDLAGVLYTVDASEWTANSGQADNVFVPVPNGAQLDDLVAVSSWAEISPSDPSESLKFVLSSVCSGGPTTTSSTTTSSTSTSTSSTSTSSTSTSTSSTSTSTSSTSSTTTSSTSTSTSSTSSTSSTTTSSTSTSTSSTSSTSVPAASTTTPPTSSTQPPSPPTATTTTTTITESGGPTTTSLPGANPPTTTTTTAVPSLPKAGSASSQMLILVGGTLLLVGLHMLLVSRRLVDS